MTKEEVKETAEDLLINIIDYIQITDIPDKEKCEIYVELACSLLTVIVDTNQSKEEIVDDIMEELNHMGVMCIGALLDYKNGNLTNVKKEYGG